MVDVVVNVDTSKATRLIQKAPREMVSALREFFTDGSQIAVETMRSTLAPMLTRAASGKTVQSIEAVLLPEGITVGPTTKTLNGLDIGTLLELGTRQHVIRPVRAKVLAWAGMGKGFVGPVSFVREGVRRGRRTTRIGLGTTSGGRDRTRTGPLQYAAEVHHPGTRDLRFIEETARRVQFPLEQLLARKVDEALRRAEA